MSKGFCSFVHFRAVSCSAKKCCSVGNYSILGSRSCYCATNMFLIVVSNGRLCIHSSTETVCSIPAGLVIISIHVINGSYRQFRKVVLHWNVFGSRCREVIQCPYRLVLCPLSLHDEWLQIPAPTIGIVIEGAFPLCTTYLNPSKSAVVRQYHKSCSCQVWYE